MLGEIAPVDPAAPKIRFQLNLPRATGTAKILQYGEAVSTACVITGMAPLRDAAARNAVAHRTRLRHLRHRLRASGLGPSAEVGAWALNEEVLVNFAYASCHKKDVAHVVAADLRS